MKKPLVISGLLVLILIISIVGFSNWWGNRVTQLDPPLIKSDKEKVGKEISLTGIAYPNANVVVFIDDKYIADLPVSYSDGSFQGNISFTKEGENKLKVKQRYKNISSDFSNVITFDVDLTPPSIESFEITSSMPETSVNQKITIEGLAEPNEYVVLNGYKAKVDSGGLFSIDYSLLEGKNILKFGLEDNFKNSVDTGKEYKILVDSTPPKISTGFCNFSYEITVKQLGASEEFACLNIEQWQGYLDSTNSVPITGKIHGNIKSVTVAGKAIYWDEKEEIYQRINLFIYGGLNKYKVVVTDIAGNQSITYLETTAERDNKEIDFNINE